MSKHFDKSRAGAKGGRSRARELSPERGSEIARAGAKARWRNRQKLVKATHAGVLELGGTSIDCAVLEDGRRVLSQRAFMTALGRANAGGQTYQRRVAYGADELPIYLSLKCLRPFIPEALSVTSIPYELSRGGTIAHGVDAAVVPKVCEVWLAARDAGALTEQQMPTAARAELIMRGLAQIGIIALVDEATGYQYDRDRKALVQILECFIAKELARWVKRFPDEYYKGLARLKGLEYGGQSQRPLYFGHLTNDIVYKRLAPGVLNELRTKNPKNARGHRGARHHQWLTEDIGHPKLQEHLGKVIALMEIAPDYATFIHYLDRVAPRFGDTLQLPMPELAPIATS